MHARHRRSVAWLAIVLVALNALWPLAAHARPNAPGILVPLCTIDGVTHYTELPTPKSPVEQRSDANHEHCKFCVFGAERAFLPAAASHLAACSAGEFVPASTAVTGPGLSFHCAARPRAPPGSS